MVTIALIGADGAGKTTIGRRLEDELPFPTKYLYMGVNAAAGNHVLPTTRLVRAVKKATGAPPDTAGPPDPLSARRDGRGGGLTRRARRSARATLRLLNRLAEEWHRQLLAWRHERRGEVVIFDRHYFSDYLAYDITGGPGLPLSRRIHGLLLAKAYPRPDLVIFLDAPAQVLLDRKGEGTLESLERRRGDYLAVAPHSRRFEVVDASQPVDVVLDEVVQLVRAAAGDHRAGR